MPNEQASPGDPLEFVRNMWGNMGFSLPGMVAPTFDVDELEKRIADLKTVEGWLRMNLSMLQMTIQGLEMQKATVTAVRAMGTMAAGAAQAAQGEPAPGPAGAPEGGLSEAALWPWNMMQQMQEHLQQQATPAATEAAAKAGAPRKAKKG